MYAENRVHYLLLGVCFAWTIILAQAGDRTFGIIR